MMTLQAEQRACGHEWVIPRFGAEDERECRKCRVTAGEVTQAEQRGEASPKPSSPSCGASELKTPGKNSKETKDEPS